MGIKKGKMVRTKGMTKEGKTILRQSQTGLTVDEKGNVRVKKAKK